ncbi:MAG: hypothetical protein QXR81_08165 [Candidatus Nezhaarchaeales archaeon]
MGIDVVKKPPTVVTSTGKIYQVVWLPFDDFVKVVSEARKHNMAPNVYIARTFLRAFYEEKGAKAEVCPVCNSTFNDYEEHLRSNAVCRKKTQRLLNKVEGRG